MISDSEIQNIFGNYFNLKQQQQKSKNICDLLTVPEVRLRNKLKFIID